MGGRLEIEGGLRKAWGGIVLTLGKELLETARRYGGLVDARRRPGGSRVSEWSNGHQCGGKQEPKISNRP